MPINLKAPQLKELKPRIAVCGVGGAGGNAINNMIVSGLSGVDFVVANTDAQALTSSCAPRIIQMGLQVTEARRRLRAGDRQGGGRGDTGGNSRLLRRLEHGFPRCRHGRWRRDRCGLSYRRSRARDGYPLVGVVTKPFHFESGRRMRVAEAGIAECARRLIRSLSFRIRTCSLSPTRGRPSLTPSGWRIGCFALASPALLTLWSRTRDLDFADVCSIMSEMGTAVIGAGEAAEDHRAHRAAEAASANPLFDDTSLKGARGVLISITGGEDLRCMKLTRPRARYARKSTRKLTSSWVRSSSPLSSKRCGCRSSRRASINRPIDGWTLGPLPNRFSPQTLRRLRWTGPRERR